MASMYACQPCCSGSGSGSSGSGENKETCCGCNEPVFWPVTMQLTLNISCMGIYTFTIDRSLAGNPCVKCSGFGGIPSSALVSYQNIAIIPSDWDGLAGFYRGNDCSTGLVVSTKPGILGDQFFLTCIPCGIDCSTIIPTGPTSTYWQLSFIRRWFHGGVYKSVTGRVRMHLVSCNPLVFSDYTTTIICQDSVPADPGCGSGSGGGSGSDGSSVWSVTDLCVGTSITIHLSE